MPVKWSIEQLRTTNEMVFPEGLADLLETLTANVQENAHG
jgi:hypothetical protein